MSRAERLTAAAALAADPTELISEFLTSIEVFGAGYSNVDLPFIPVNAKRTPLPPDPERFANTEDVAGWMSKTRRHSPPGHPELSFEYVDREVSIMRTLNRAAFDDPKAGPAGNPLVPDLLLANTTDRTPIVGEVKVTDGDRTDKDPYAALIQALAAVAHLATSNQYERLRATFPDADYREPGDQLPQLELYLFLVRFDREMTDMAGLIDAVEVLSGKLVEDDRFRAHLRRIAAIDIDNERGQPRSDVLFSTD